MVHFICIPAPASSFVAIFPASFKLLGLWKVSVTLAQRFCLNQARAILDTYGELICGSDPRVHPRAIKTSPAGELAMG
jgi:hypothetical protein